MKNHLKHLLMKRNRDIIAQYNIQLEQQHRTIFTTTTVRTFKQLEYEHDRT